MISFKLLPFYPGKRVPGKYCKGGCVGRSGDCGGKKKKNLLCRKPNSDSPSPSLITTQTELYQKIYFSTTHFHNTPSTTPGIPRSLSSKLSDHNFGCICDFLCACHTRSPMQRPMFGHLKHVSKEYKQQTYSVFPHLPVSSLFVKLKYSSRCFVLHTPIYIFPSESKKARYIFLFHFDISVYAYYSISRATPVVAYNQKDAKFLCAESRRWMSPLARKMSRAVEEVSLLIGSVMKKSFRKGYTAL